MPDDKLNIQFRVFEAIQNREFKKASQLVARYEAKQPKPRGIGIDWDHYDSTRAVKLLEAICAAFPTRLAHYRMKEIQHLQIVACADVLWSFTGTEILRWLPNELVEKTPFGGVDAVRYLCNIAYNQWELESIRELDYGRNRPKVEISTCNDSHVCPSCRRLASTTYTVDAAPKLPHDDCTNHHGCRCRYNATFD